MSYLFTLTATLKVKIIQLPAKSETAMMSRSRFIQITNFSDHRRASKENILHTLKLPNPLGLDLVDQVTASYKRGSYFKPSCPVVNTSMIRLVHNAEAVVRNCSIKKVFIKKFRGKHLCQSLFLRECQSLRPANLLKKRLQHRYFI